MQDASGAAVSGATVRIVNEGTNGSITTQASETGSYVYVFEALQPGSYTLNIAVAGFKKFSSKSNRLNIGQPMTVNVTLEVGQVTETVEVAGNFTAEYGRNSGGQVAMVTKPGTTEFHGDAFWFYRTPRLNANEW